MTKKPFVDKNWSELKVTRTENELYV